MFNTLLRNVILTRTDSCTHPRPKHSITQVTPFSVTYISYTHAYLHAHTFVCVCRDHTKSLGFLEKAQVMYTAVKESGVSPQGVRTVYTSTDEASVSMPAGGDSFHVCWHLLNVKILWKVSRLIPLVEGAGEEGWVDLESTYTHTLFFLAQCYGNLGNGAKSAEHCTRTLQRQLESKR